MSAPLAHPSRSFPKAPRAIKNYLGLKKPDGYPFNPSERPFILFKGNTVHSTGYQWGDAACIYFGGIIIYRVVGALWSGLVLKHVASCCLLVRTSCCLLLRMVW